MAELRAKLDQLAMSRKPIVVALDSIMSQTSIPLVLTLPPEITAEIFIHDAAGPHDLHENGPLPRPLLLASICREWRHIALNSSLPSIWAKIRICRYLFSTTENLLRCWLPRAGCYPLELDTRGVRSKDSNRTLDALALHSMQWATLD
ncbi:hypothetical protein C8R44DRAFT_975122, partial [Mycena epipterygia]